MMIKRPLVTGMAIALLVVSCGQPAATPTATPVRPIPTPTMVPTPTAAPTPTVEPTVPAPAVEWVPFVSQNFALKGIAPQDWSALGPGRFARLASPSDQAVVLVASYADAPQEWLRYYVTRALPILELPPSVGSRQTPFFHWDLHSFEGQNAEGVTVGFDLAVARAGTAIFAIFLQSPLQEHEALQQSVFLPMVDALESLSLAQRDELTAAELMAAEVQAASPLQNAYFAPMGQHSAAKTDFEGKLTVPGFKMSFIGLMGQPASPGQDQFPGFSAQFFTYRDMLVPVESGILPALDPDSFWSIILSPGEIWSEPDDSGMSRAAFPFLLVSADSNEAHNGLATFLYDGERASSFRFQVVQETVPWNRFDAWGQHTMSYEPGQVANREALVEQLSDQLDRDLEVRPWSELEAQHDAVLLGTFTGPVDLLDISATGLIVEDSIYMQPCYTRYGDFPYCQYMRHGIFSVTKSMGGAMAMLQLAQRYGEEVFDLHVAEYVTVPASHDGWQAVTFADALNQATGIGDDPSPQVKDITSEEGTEKWNRFAMARSTQEKLDVIATYGKYPWGPGEVARYNSTNVFVLSVAMDRFLKSQEGPQADIWDMVLEEVYNPIGIYAAPIMRTLEPDGSRGVPIFGYGMYPTVQDMAKVAMLLRNGGQHEGRQLLHAGKVAEILSSIEEAGLPSSEFNAFGEGRYHLSFWAMPYRSRRGDKVMIPYMSGFGGNRVVFNPNGIISFRVTDAVNYELDHLVRVADGIGPFPTSSGQ